MSAAEPAARPPWPSRLRFQKAAARLVVEYDDGETVTIPYRHLRAESPSAAVRGHGSGPRPPQPPIPDDVTVTGANPIGRYAVQIVFSDGHDSGYYTWTQLRDLGAGA
ncbi:MAG: gamma-butyrobetaine hydroxylase-like domain-containing protein [Pseudomonadota bacterium]